MTCPALLYNMHESAKKWKVYNLAFVGNSLKYNPSQSQEINPISQRIQIQHSKLVFKNILIGLFILTTIMGLPVHENVQIVYVHQRKMLYEVHHIIKSWLTQDLFGNSSAPLLVMMLFRTYSIGTDYNLKFHIP